METSTDGLLYYNTTDVMRLTGINSPITLHRRVAKGSMPAPSLFIHKRLWDRVAFDAWLKERKQDNRNRFGRNGEAISNIV